MMSSKVKNDRVQFHLKSSLYIKPSLLIHLKDGLIAPFTQPELSVYPLMSCYIIHWSETKQAPICLFFPHLPTMAYSQKLETQFSPSALSHHCWFRAPVVRNCSELEPGHFDSGCRDLKGQTLGANFKGSTFGSKWWCHLLWHYSQCF